jgi:hypothetical protein
MQFIYLVAGVIAILLAFFAEWLGIDNNPVWGTGRYLLLIFGIALSIFAVLLHFWKTGRFPSEIRYKIVLICGTLWKVCFRIIHWLTCWQPLSIVLGVIVVFLIAFYALWYTSAGRFPIFSPVTNTYVDLGDAFLHGQLSLLQKPDPRLATLTNPFDSKQRIGIPFIWDSSYYKGKFYLYWGPAPALMSSIAEWILQARPPDQLGVLISYIGLAIILLVLLIHIRKRFFPRVPGISIPVFLLAAFINSPYLFILGRPQIYETSIITGQFFLIFGILAWMRYQIAGRYFWLGLAGLSWGLAIASRYNLVVSVGVFVIFVLYSCFRTKKLNSDFPTNTKGLFNLLKGTDWNAIVAFLVPLILCGFALGMYNYARFGNPLETGLTYQLTLSEPHILYYSAAYTPSNLYMYLVYPINSTGVFPFFKSAAIQYNLLPSWAAMPTGKMFDEVLFGLLPTLPLIWPLILLIPLTVVGIVKGRHSIRLNEEFALDKPSRLLLTMLLIACSMQFVFLLVFFYGAMRYIVDFYLPLLLAAYITIWAVDKQIRQILFLRWLFWLGIIGLAIWTVVIGFFIGFDIPPQYLRAENPQLFGTLYTIWNHQYNLVSALLGKPQVLAETLTRITARVAGKFGW